MDLNEIEISYEELQYQLQSMTINCEKLKRIVYELES